MARDSSEASPIVDLEIAVVVTMFRVLYLGILKTLDTMNLYKKLLGESGLKQANNSRQLYLQMPNPARDTILIFIYSTVSYSTFIAVLSIRCLVFDCLL